MRRLAVLLGMLVAVSIGYALDVCAQEDSVKIDGVSTICELHSWFDKEILELSRKYHGVGKGYRLTPLGIYKTPRVIGIQDTAKWNIGAEYHLPLNTMNGSFTVFSHDFGKVEAYAKLFFGFGKRPIMGTSDSLDIEATANYGVNGELFFEREDQWLNPLAGLTYLWVRPDKGADGQGNYLYIGNRMFFGSSRILSLDLRGGSAMWRGFDENSPAGWFASAGLTLHSLVDVTKVGKPVLAPIEVGLIGNVSLKSLGGKLLLPLRLRKGVTLAPVLEYGREVGTEPYDNVIGVGAELRLFGDVSISPLNPYIGFQQTWLMGGPNNGSGTSVYFGSRLYLHDLVALDANFGPAFWQSDIQDEYGLKEWMGRIGVVFAFGKIRDKYTVRGKIVTRTGAWGTNAVDTRNFERLTDDDFQKYGEEVREYGLEEYSHPPPIVIQAGSFGDITDLKFFRLDLDFGLELDPLNTKAGLLNKGEDKDDNVFIAVLFNKENTLVDSLTDKNTLFHFLDLDSSQYFGYRWDSTLSRQPEYRDLEPLGTEVEPANQPYMGLYNEFVQPMTWLDDSTLLGFIDGKSVQKKVLEVISEEAVKKGLDSLEIGKYRVGYVTFSECTLAKLTAYRETSNLGVAIMIGDDQNRARLDTLTAKYRLGQASDTVNTTKSAADGKVKPKKSGDHYFSNHVQMENIFKGYPFEPCETGQVIIDNFDLCSVTLKLSQKQVLDKLVVERLKRSPGVSVHLCGYVDATAMTDSCQYKGKEDRLAEGRALSVKKYLIDSGIPHAQIIDVECPGPRNPPRSYEPADRCVIVKFSD